MSEGASSDDAAQEALDRSLYWAQGRGANELGAAGIREEILDMVGRLRADERALIPLGEPTLNATTPLKRRVKYTGFRLLRFVSRRYDRLLIEEAELMAALAAQVATVERQVAAVLERLDRLDGGVQSGAGGAADDADTAEADP